MVSPGQPTPAPFRTRTDVLFASRAPVAVILRRGPRTHWQLILWDTRRNTFTPGQWMKGLVKLMDLSPRGDKLIYWAAQYHASAHWHRTIGSTERRRYDPLEDNGQTLRRLQHRHPRRKVPRYLASIAGAPPGRRTPREVQGVWTAVSTPPYFSALAIWPTIGHWTGGGYFEAEDSIVLFESNAGLTPIAGSRLPSTIRVGGWERTTPHVVPSTLAINPSRSPSALQAEIALALQASGARFVDWTHVANDSVLFACDGGIWRHDGVPASITPDILPSARRLIDLSLNRFELIQAPASALRW